jgi:alkylhydroperoxidase/carboxymuconolactone decarboxylase family protein YurZ
MATDEALSPKEEALIGMAASIAGGCRPCARRWLKAARSAGACERSVRLAIETGLAVHATATREMADFAEAQQGSVPDVDEAFRSSRARFVELLSCGAALAARSAVGLERHLDSARGCDATPAQIGTALAIGRAVGEMAAEEAQKVIRRSGLDGPATLSGPWCCETLSAAAKAQGGCGCAGEQR